jgi:hypothetical protein
MQLLYDDHFAHNSQAKCIIQSDSDHKIKWDIFVCALLLFCVVVIPYRLAFSDEESFTWETIYYVMDFFFLIDMVISFFTTIPDSD